MKKFLAIFLAILMVSTSCVTFIAALDDVGGSGDWITVNGDTDTDHWYGPVIAKSNFDYRVTSDETNLYLEFKTDDALPATGNVFRFWFRDESDSAVYTDFITIGAIASGIYTVSAATANTSKTINSGTAWSAANKAAIKLSNTLASGVTTFKVTVPITSFNGLASQNHIDYWVSDFVKSTAPASTLHSGNATNQPHVLWDTAEDNTIFVLDSAPVLDGKLLESIWQDDVTTVDGVTNGQWQTSSSTANAAFSYNYKAYATNGYLYVGVKYNKAPTFVSDSQTTASQIRIWMTKDIMKNSKGSFGNLVDIRYNGTNAVIVPRADDLDRSAMLLKDTQTASSWTVEFAVPLTQLGFESFEVGDYIGLTLTCSDPFMTDVEGVMTNKYGALHSYYGFSYTDRTTANLFYFDCNSDTYNLGAKKINAADDDTNVSNGKTYSGTVPARTNWTDNTAKDKLTNGVPGTLNSLGGSSGFIGYQVVKNTSYNYEASTWVEKTTTFSADERDANGNYYQIIDLGVNTEKIYKYSAKFGQIAAYGILFPTRVAFYASADGETYYRLGLAAQGTVTNNGAATPKEWADYTYTSNEGITARYIKIEMTPNIPSTVPTVPVGTVVPEGATAAVTKTSVTAISEFTVTAKGGLLPDYDTSVINLKADNVDLVTTTTALTSNTGYLQYTAALNDDVASSVASYDNKWFGFFYNGNANPTNTTDGTGFVNVDFGAVKSVGTVKVNVWQPNASGIGIPTIRAFASINNKDWLEIGTLTNPTGAIGWATLNLTNPINAQYIKLVVTSNAAFAMINEVEIYQYAVQKTFSIDFANQYNVGYQGTGWVYNGGETLAGVGDAVYVFTPSYGATLGEAASAGIAWWDVWVIDYNAQTSKYFIKSFAASSGDNKASIAIPEKGFIIAANGHGRDLIDASLRAESAIGASVYVYGMNIEALGVENTMDFVDINTISVFAPITDRTAVLPYIAGVFNESDESQVAVLNNKSLSVLSDGNRALTATAFSNAQVVLFQNKVCTTADTYPTIELVLALGDETDVTGVNLCFYHEYLSMIGLPKDNTVTISYATDISTFTEIDDFTFEGVAETGKSGVIDAIFEFDETVTAKFIKVAFDFDDSPFETKVIWEFMGLTEFAAIVELEEIPEGALPIQNFAGFVAGEGTIITRIGDLDTLGEVSGACSGTVKDYNYHYMVVVNAEGVVTAINQTLGRPAGVKTDVVIPEGGYVLLYHAATGLLTQTMLDSFKAIKVGDEITLYNVDFERLVAGKAVVTLDSAAFTVEAGTSYPTGVTIISDSTKVVASKALTVLSDGDKLSTLTTFDNAGVVLFQNKICTTANTYPTVDLVLALADTTDIDTVALSFYQQVAVMVYLPKDLKVTVSYATDPTSFTSLGEFTFTNNNQANGVYDAVLSLGETVNAKYIKVSFAFGDSGVTTDGKIIAEWMALTEFGVSLTEVSDPFELVEDAGVIIADGFLTGNALTDDMTIEQIKALFVGEVTVSGVGTGATITSGDQTIIIVVKGDVNGDGDVGSIDYLYVKRAFLETMTLTETQLQAACLGGTALPTSADYLKIKRHFLGTFDIYAVTQG
ncbi:MAG: hypothetical protein A2Y15_06430 [Clostridiales bacterium GWF2_36_10]|nr:MAG: hypothetical protein A2Y15_06430 [Clostridiales bacterium GWF2_36_10]HAN21849.1 hypothetical protein [Clostridiales bacterium]